MIDTRRRQVTQLGGHYEDQYQCVDGEWKISGTRYQVSSTQLLELSEGLLRILFAGCQAPAEIDDPSLQVTE